MYVVIIIGISIATYIFSITFALQIHRGSIVGTSYFIHKDVHIAK